MFSARGYETREQIHDGEQSLIFRAIRREDDLPVILKVLKDVQPPPERIARFKREYELVGSLDLSCVVEAHDLLHAANHWVFVQEDFGGESLARLGLAGHIDADQFLDIAIALAGHVVAIHERGVIHKDLNPANIVLARDSGVVKIIDFGIATRLTRETVAFDHLSLVEGTPAYLSPEQTGRINHPLDHRTDLYSLGCTFYELLTGRPPFEAAGVMELLHCHLARLPLPPHEVQSNIPRGLSAVVEKLLAKNPGDRYQSGRGLKLDLEHCREQWRSDGRVAAFELATHDFDRRLSWPARLYGRGPEITELQVTFERVGRGASEVLLVSGDPGVGKSALLEELYRPVTQRRGFFVTGKFDQLRRDTPYGPILEALDGLVGQILMEPPPVMATWAKAIRDAAGPMLPSLVSILPRLELLYEQLPATATVSAAEAKRRFVHVLIDFIRVFAAAEHPLVLFIDDLQWSDSASLELLRRLVVDDPIPYSLILGAYRGHEVPVDHPLRSVLRDVCEAGVEVRQLDLTPLDLSNTASLLADMLHQEFDEVQAPARLVHDKTGGNPFFIHTFLQTLESRGVLRHDSKTGCWKWDIDQLRALDSSDNVVDMLVTSLGRLPEATRELISRAACIGNRFELSLLAQVSGRSRKEVADALMPALVDNTIIPLSGDYRLLEADVEDLDDQLEVTYKFAHDRIQQAAVSLEPADTHAAIHLRIGRAMRARARGAPSDARAQVIVNQLNRAWWLLESAEERQEVATLNLEAGRNAKAAVANVAALRYLETGLAILGNMPVDDESAWPTVYARSFAQNQSLALAVIEEAAEAAYLASDFETMDRHIDAILRHVGRLRDRLKVVQLRIDALAGQSRFQDAIELARRVLAAGGIELPDEVDDSEIEAQIEAVRAQMGARRPLDLADLPAMEDAEAEAMIQLLNSIWLPAFLTQPPLANVVTAQMVLLSLRQGLTERSAHGFLLYGWLLCGRGSFALGNEFGRLAEHLVETHQYRSQMADLAVVGSAYMFHWQRSIHEFVPKMRAGYRIGVEVGTIESAFNALQCSAAMGYLAGHELSAIDQEYVDVARTMEEKEQGSWLHSVRLYHQAVRNFRGLNDHPTRLIGDIYDEVVEFPAMEEAGNLAAVYHVYFNKVILCYHFADYPESLRCARKLEADHQPSSVFLPIAVMYQCLALLAIDGEPQARVAAIEEASELVDRMKGWADSGPINYAHKYHLMAAELARARGRYAEARDHYDEAIELAREHEFTNEQALALERAAISFLEHQNHRVAGYYMRDAYYTYGRWGASAKQAMIRSRYGHLLDREARPRAPTRGDESTATGELSTVDLDTVLAATRAITTAHDLGMLLEVVMRSALENAGAQRGHLILVRDDRLIVKVRGELTAEQSVESVSLALEDEGGLARTVVQYVARTAEPVILDHAAQDGMFTRDLHIRDEGCKSILCLPILNQGRLVAITYLENNQATSVFNEDRIDLLTLLMGQAAVSIENALLRQVPDEHEFQFRVGGSLPADSPSYVRREADERLARNIERGEFCYVFNTRQMGKSSLRVRTVERLGRAGVVCASIDITSIGSHEVTVQQWYAGIARVLLAGLGLNKDVDLRRWWRAHEELSAVQRLDVLVDEEILPRIDAPIAVFVDEVDAVLGLSFSADDLFALIRLFYNRRAEDPRYERLSVVLLGVATPGDLIRDKRHTPFNIGRAIPLSGFRFDEARTLIPGLAHVGDGERLLRVVLDWTHGQPFLTQKLCRLIASDESRPVAGKERQWVGELVRRRVIHEWRRHDEPEHLGTIEARILQGPEGAVALLSRYREILEHGEVEADGSPLETSLVLCGLVTRALDKLRVGNPIYAAIFDHQWIEDGLARSR